MAQWFGALYNQRRSALVQQCKKGPQVLTSLLNQRGNYYYYGGKIPFINYRGMALLFGAHNNQEPACIINLVGVIDPIFR